MSAPSASTPATATAAITRVPRELPPGATFLGLIASTSDLFSKRRSVAFTFDFAAKHALRRGAWWSDDPGARVR